MNRKKISDRLIRTAAALLPIILFAASNTALAATYYVSTSGRDGNSGTQSQPWRTIQYAANTMMAGDTAIVGAGTYSEDVSTVRNGSAGNRISFRATGAAVLNGTFSINNSHITFDGFEVTGWAGENAAGIRTNSDADYCEILNNNIHDFAGRGIELPRSAGTPAHPANCLIKGNWMHGQRVATLYLMFGGVNHLIEQNEFGPGIVREDAMRVWGDNHRVRNNYIHDVQSGGGHTDVFQSFGQNGWIIRNFVFENNVIRNWDGQAWMLECLPESSGVIVRNNIYENVRSAGNSYCKRTLVYNNVFVDSGYGNCRAVMIRSSSTIKGAADNSEIKNNIFYNTGCSDSNGWYSVDAGVQSTFEAGHNLVFPAKSGFSEPDGINGEDPRFIDVREHNFRVHASSPAIDAGTTLVGFNYDYDGTGRPQGSAWDIGPYEASGGGGAGPLTPPENLRVAE